jgi:hypothetical protein
MKDAGQARGQIWETVHKASRRYFRDLLVVGPYVHLPRVGLSRICGV